MALRDLDKTGTWIHTSEEKAGLDMKVLDGKQAKQSKAHCFLDGGLS